MFLPVNEIFQTIQGEAFWTGMPATFVRLQGCAVGCPWCDTKYTWETHSHREIGIEEMMAKTMDDDRYAMVPVGELAYLCKRFAPTHVVITGGEPADHDLRELTRGLYSAGFHPQIETSGTAPIRVDRETWVTVSPKLNMPGGKPFLPESLDRAQEIKMPVGKPADVTALQELMGCQHFPTTPIVWFQPLSKSEKATRICMDAAMATGARVSIQTHRYLGIR